MNGALIASSADDQPVGSEEQAPDFPDISTPARFADEGGGFSVPDVDEGAGDGGGSDEIPTGSDGETGERGSMSDEDGRGRVWRMLLTIGGGPVRDSSRGGGGKMIGFEER
ncbi:hypothetical protein PGTUg99_034817 [Puccinia graminis f. sp. tritici]|uniref:Uncharacterized protein n=1 Tax=Puccinia graminis f. sp. tritici TaxID=56615 RepID=A0A5B0NJT7_PUCGR|nr:hypothetical protein PGTUg99_034817 [Puccinia graminis f. sp. tritici]